MKQGGKVGNGADVRTVGIGMRMRRKRGLGGGGGAAPKNGSVGWVKW